ncbi:hypothetical protein [Pseudomonas abietaniphila]|uniref:Phosphatidylinositol diacylglycerol-lyase n=1 Tax=Pseudomonas abietaniphila TaxID=89065 RepID=A0A1G8FAW0_9PSED|nr:hypothetical protein [Pseudomonas abietaniphila]SDH79109.1 hypothetical protein SAMN05216605_108148 [Pseudomonas abietaniphila]
MDDFLVPLGGDAPARPVTIPPDPQDPNQRTGVEISAINEHRGTWMSYYAGAGDLRIVDLILPGTHDSGMDKEAPYTASNESTQDRSPWYQLMSGIRVLDLRVQFFSGYSVNDPRRFQLFHGAPSGRTVRGDVLQAVTNWRNEIFPKGDPKREIVILDFHQFKNFTNEAHHELMKLVKDYFGDLIIREDQRNLYVRELWRGTGRVVVSYHDVIRDETFTWDLDQKYAGTGWISTDDLKKFMDSTSTRHKPDGGLESIQCHQLAGLGVPDDFQGQIGEWFYSNDVVGINAYIQKFHIINTDWATRGKYIDYCIHANFVRAKIYSQHQNIFVEYDDDDFEIPPLQTPSIYVVIRAAVANVYLPVYQGSVEDGAVLGIENASGRSLILHMSGSDYGAPKFELSYPGVARLKYDLKFKGYRCIDPPPMKFTNFAIKTHDGFYPIELSWDLLPSHAGGYEVEVTYENRVQHIAVTKPPLIIESDHRGLFSVRANVSGSWVYSESILFTPEVPTEISNFRRTTPDVSYPLVLEWDAVPTVSEYEVVLEKTDGRVESRIVNQPRVSIERGAQGKWHVEATVIGQRIRSDTVGFSSPILEFYKFELEYYGQYPFTFQWTEIDGAQKYTVVWEGAEGTTTYDVTEPRLEVKKDGVGRWYVTALDFENQPVRSPAVYFPPKITNFRLEDDGQYPFRLSWDPVPEVMVYTVRHLPIFGRVKYIDVTDPWLVVEKKGGGTWCVILEGTEGLEHLFSEVRRFTPPLAE